MSKYILPLTPEEQAALIIFHDLRSVGIVLTEEAEEMIFTVLYKLAQDTARQAFEDGKADGLETD